MGNCSRPQERDKSQSSTKLSMHTSGSQSLQYPETLKLHNSSSSEKFTNPLQRKIATKKRQPIPLEYLQILLSKDALTSVVTDRPKTSLEKAFIKKSLKKHSVFDKLHKTIRHFVIDEMKHYSLDSQQIVFSQGEPGNNFFVLYSGSVDLIVNGVEKAQILPGASFGELALLYDSLRTATIRTRQPSELWGIDRKTFRDAVKAINAKEYSENKEFIENIPLFHLLKPEQRDSLLAVLVRMDFASGKIIVSEGEPGEIFYIIKEGTVSCSKGGEELRQMGKGEFFGEQALLYNTQRTATVTAVTFVTVLSLGREHLTVVLGDSLPQILYRNSQRMILEKIPALLDLTKFQIDSIAERMQVYEYSTGDCIISKGIPIGDSLWVILNGALVTSEQNHEYTTHDFIGSEALQGDPQGSYDEDYIAQVPSCISKISKTELDSCLGGDLSNVSSNNELVSILQLVRLFMCLTKPKLAQLARVLLCKSYAESNVIFNEGDPGDSFYIVKEGKVDISRKGVWIRSIGKNDYFGERSILLNEARTASVTANEGTVCLILDRSDFLRLIEGPARTQLIQRMELQDDSVQICDLELVSLLGKGMFGNVYLIIHKETQVKYALKAVARTKIHGYGIYECLSLERSILLQLDHPFIVKLVKTLKDDQRVYFLLEYVKGMDLFDVIRTFDVLSDKDSKFYAASLMLILEHLHERNIIYRDLKPENIMVDQDGYLKLIDFGAAKIVSDRAYTVTGTPHYMSPEVIMGKGYSTSVDLWALGVMLFEFLCGGVPFGEEEEDPYYIYEKVLEHSIVYPWKVQLDPDVKLLIEQLLSFNPALRGNCLAVKEHPWFSGVNWDSLLSKESKAPYIPTLKKSPHNLNANLSLEEVIFREEQRDLFEIPCAEGRQEVSGWDEDF